MLVQRMNIIKSVCSRVGLGSVRLMATQQQESSSLVTFERLSGADRGIALYGLNSPRERNALGFQLLEAMKEVNQLIREDTKLSVVILHSMVPGIFCAGKLLQQLFYIEYLIYFYHINILCLIPGANLKERFKMADEEVAIFVRGLRGIFIEIEDLPMPTIAAIDGVAVGGGLELALACDIRIASESARLGLVETGRGLIPGAGGTQRLPRAVHLNIAKELIFTSRIINGNEAKELGKQ